MKIFELFSDKKNGFKITLVAFLLIFVFSPRLTLAQTLSLPVEHIGAGTDYETPAYILQSQDKEDKEPVIMIVAGIHGDEIAGIKAAEYLKDNLEIEKGTLIIIPQANILACKKRVRNYPPEVNLNRVYPGNLQGNEIEKLAYEIFNLGKKYDIDMLIDLHESIEFYRKNPQNYGQTIVIDSNDDYLFQLSSFLAEEMNADIVEEEYKYQVLVDPIPGSTAYSAYYQLGIPALTFETCKKLPLSFRIEEHRKLIETILLNGKLISLKK